MPTPKLGIFNEPDVDGEALSAPGTDHRDTTAALPSSTPTTQPESGRSAPNVSQPRNLRKSSFGFPDADPWGSPAMHRGHDHAPTNGNGAPSTIAAAGTATAAAITMPQRTTSAFTTTSQSTSSIPDRAAPTRQSTSSDGGWGFTGGPNDTFRGPNQGAGFGDPSGDGGGDGPNHPSGLGAIIAPRLGGISAPDEVITVNSLPEKEGMFLFQHRNYQVTSTLRNSRVIRRYSDFVWLLDCLHKRYPFRQLPLLPPKSFASKFE